MPAYRVSLTRAAYEYAEVVITADTPEQAEAEALRRAEDKQIHTWESCNGEGADPAYMIDLAEVEPNQ